jgi:hypothetical protein
MAPRTTDMEPTSRSKLPSRRRGTAAIHVDDFQAAAAWFHHLFEGGRTSPLRHVCHHHRNAIGSEMFRQGKALAVGCSYVPGP